MARILLIGRGPLPSADAPQTGFSQLRTQAFHDALVDAGHAVRLVSLVPNPTRSVGSEWPGILEVCEEGAGWIERTAEASAGAELVVSAGPYNPGRLAVAVAGERPLWVDIPGDPSAELSALSRATPGGLTDPQLAAAHAGAVSVLSRADGMSVISEAQRHATLGQLGLMGRLLKEESTPSLATVPISGGFVPHADPNVTRASGRVVALAGAFNPWVDVAALTTCLDSLLDAREDSQVICTGGGIPGFYEAGFERFKAWAATRGSRVTIHGWLPHNEMVRTLQQAHIGLSMDAEGPEPELGSRTRLLLYAELGLAPASTVRCELAQQWANADALIPLPIRNPEEAGRLLATIAIDDGVSSRAAALCPTARAVCEPLVEWCAQPRRCTTAPSPEGAMAAELDLTKDKLAQVYASPTWTAMNRLHGLGQSAADRFRARSK